MDYGGKLMQTPNEIRKAGLTVLRNELGIVGMVRFLHQFELGDNNYTIERKKWLKDVELEEIETYVEDDR
jgi:hypothetical protein